MKDGRIIFPDGMSYRLLVLPRLDTMTPPLLRKIKQLVDAGATVIGEPPRKSPSLENYPQCDAEIERLAAETWRSGRVIRDTPATAAASDSPRTTAKGTPHPQFPDMYCDYQMTAQVLSGMNIPPDFESDGDVRYVHRHELGADIYFVGNRTSAPLSATCRFRVTGLRPELWDPVTGCWHPLPEFRRAEGRTSVPLEFAPGQSYFVVFRDGPRRSGTNFPPLKSVVELAGPWEVTFDAKWGGPDKPVTFKTLQDWTRREEDGIRYYSGTAIYRKTFDVPSASPGKEQFLDLGEVKNLARVTLNGRDLGVAWCPPWRVALPAGLLKPAGNQLEIKVANLWPNRLIKDAGLPRSGG